MSEQLENFYGEALRNMAIRKAEFMKELPDLRNPKGRTDRDRKRLITVESNIYLLKDLLRDFKSQYCKLCFKKGV